jgi:hypothetical protein
MELEAIEKRATTKFGSENPPEIRTKSKSTYGRYGF